MLCSAEHRCQSLAHNAFGFSGYVCHQVLAALQLVNEALALTHGPDAAVDIATFQYVGTTAGTGHQFFDIIKGLAGILLNFRNLRCNVVARNA